MPQKKCYIPSCHSANMKLKTVNRTGKMTVCPYRVSLVPCNQRFNMQKLRSCGSHCRKSKIQRNFSQLLNRELDSGVFPTHLAGNTIEHSTVEIPSNTDGTTITIYSIC